MTALSSFIPFGKVYGGANNNDTNINKTRNVNVVMNKSTSSSSGHFFDLDGAKPQFHSPTGNRTVMNAANFPILSGMGGVLLRLQKGGVREPH